MITTLNAQRSTLNAQRSTHNAQRTTHNAQRTTHNAQRTTHNKYKLIVSFFVLFLLTSGKILAQSSTNLALTWNINVGCQEVLDPKLADEPGLFLEEIVPTEFIKVCERSRVRYSLSGDLSGYSNIQWTASGGNISNTNITNTSNINSINVSWFTSGTGSVTFTMNNSNGVVISKTLNVEIIKIPTAKFNVIPNVVNKFSVISACLNQTLEFSDLSTSNGGPDINNYYWSFDDGTFSSEQSPSHSFTNARMYNVKLTVTNDCGCASSKIIRVNVSDAVGFDIECPSVVCDGQTSVYNIPQNGQQLCQNYNFSAIGGTILDNPNNGTVKVAWNNVDQTGFGYLTFNPDTTCNIECLIPTTIKIPVIQNTGTILGNNLVCIGRQEIYKMPQWPATTFRWTIVGNTTGALAEVFPTDQANEVAVRAAVPGTITLVCTYQNTFLHCGGVASLIIKVNKEQPVAGPVNLCKGNSGTYTTTSTNPVNWTLTNQINGNTITLNNSNTFTHNFATSGNYSLAVSGTDVCNNQITNIKVATVPTILPVSRIVQPVNKICPNTEYIYSIASPSPLMEYIWNITGGQIIGDSTGNSVRVQFNATGPNSLGVKQNFIGQLNCTSPIQTIIPQFLEIQADIATNDNPVGTISLPEVLNSCPNIITTYSAVNSLAGTGLYNDGETFTWSISPSYLGSVILGQGTKTITVQWNNTSEFKIADLVCLVTKCTLSKSIIKKVNISPLPQLVITTPVTACSGSNINIVLSSANGVPFNSGTTINWDFGDGVLFNQVVATTSTTVSYTKTYITQPNGNIGFVIKVIINDLNGCVGQATVSKEVTITPGPQANMSFTGANVYCPDEPIETILIPSISTGNLSFFWYKNQETLPIQVGGNLNVATFGFGNYYIKVFDAACASKSNSININLDDCVEVNVCVLPIIININKAATIDQNCNNLSLIVTASVPSLINYSTKWSVVGPGAPPNFIDVIGPTPTTISLPITKAGIYNIKYKSYYICNGDVGEIETDQEITVPYIPSFTTKVNCGTNGNASSITLTNTSSFIDTVTARRYFYYRSTNIAGPWTLINPSTPTQPNTTYITTAFGDNYFKLVIDGIEQGTTPAALCSTTPSANLKIDPTPVQIINPKNLKCHNSPVEFSILQSDENDIKFLWTFDSESLITPLAQSTLERTTRVFDPSPTGAARTVRVKVVITNIYGCERTLLKDIVIPAKCTFGGAITTTTPEICNNDPMVLTYTASAAQPNICPIVSYEWHDGNAPNALGTTTVPTYTTSNVTGQHFYWVTIKNAQGCSYDTTNRLSPIYKTPPALVLTMPSIICGSSNATATITTNATSIKWYVDNILQNNTTTSLSLAAFALGAHVLKVTVNATNNTNCARTQTQSFVIKTAAQNPTATYSIDCNTYEVTLNATPPAGGNGTLTWSAGLAGNPISVNSGGSFYVTYNDGSGCLSGTQVNVPYSLDKYLWNFPTGCYSTCDNNLGTLIGPKVTVPFWEWLQDGSADAAGTGLVSNYQPSQTATYNLQLTNQCPQKSGNMNLTVDQCVPCRITSVSKRVVECVRTDSYNGYNWQIIVYNDSANDINATFVVPNNELILTPASFVLVPGSNVLTLVAISTNNFDGGIVDFVINGLDKSNNNCSFPFRMSFPQCDFGFGRPIANASKMSTAFFENTTSLELSPNPTKDLVTLHYTCNSQNAMVTIYDLTGKQLANYQLTNKKGNMTINLNNFATGIYVAVLKEDNVIKIQQKLIKE